MPLVWGAIGAAAIGAAGSAYSSKQSADAAETGYKHRYRWQVKDLQKAGLNPMLSYSNAPPNVPQPQFENIGEGALRGYTAFQQTRLLKEQADATRAQGQKTLAEKELTEMDIQLRKADPLYHSAKQAFNPDTGEYGPSAKAEEKWQADLSVVKNTASKLEADTQVSRLSAELAKGELTLQEVKVKYADELAKIEVAYRKAMAEAEQLKIPPARAEAEFWSSAGDLGKYAQFIKQLLPNIPLPVIKKVLK